MNQRKKRLIKPVKSIISLEMIKPIVEIERSIIFSQK